jgi:hypothetical protein
VCRGIGVSSEEGPDDLAVQDPVYLTRRPVDRVRVERRLRIRARHPLAPIIGPRNAFGEIVVLHHPVGILSAQVKVVPGHLPVDLVKIVRHQDAGRDNAGARSHLHLNIHASEEYVEVCE